jgi:hypothetical protein
MDYETALNWVDALNKYNGGKGWLNHNHWQLPTTQLTDANVPPGTQNSCSSQKQGNFGALCKGSALGNLYNVGLARVYPDSVVPRVIDYVWPFINLQPGLYWTSTSQSDEGYSTFSFNTGDGGANTTDFNFLHVLPMTHDVIGTVAFSQPGVMPGQLCPAAPNCPPQAYSFNFDDGFEGTDHLKKHFYVMVYFPAATQP